MLQPYRWQFLKVCLVWRPVPASEIRLPWCWQWDTPAQRAILPHWLIQRWVLPRPLVKSLRLYG